MSFYHKSCTDCKCAVSKEWLERKKALNSGRPTRKSGKKFIDTWFVDLLRKEGQGWESW